MYDEITPERIFLALGSHAPDEDTTGPTFEKLKQSIISNGTIIQPIIVNRVGRTLLCIDGNTRLALYRDFVTRGVRGTWDKIPSVVYDNLSEQDTDAIRLQAHLVGPRPWDPYSKAKYLDFLRNKEHIPWNQLVDFCGGSQKTLKELIDAYHDMETHYRPRLSADQDFEVRRFSAFVELQKSGVKQAVESAGFDLGDFSQWVIDRRIDKLAEVRLVPRILRNPRAREIFINEGAAAAEKLLDRPDLNKQLKEASVMDLCRALRSAVDHILFADATRLKEEPGSPEALAVRDASDALSELIKYMGGGEMEQ
jgi:hypothetical protein